MSKNTDQPLDETETGFSESWLSLREPADHVARNRLLNDPLINWFKQQDTHHVLELGAGTGSNLRYLMPQLGHDQHWRLLDNDAALFDCLPALLQAWAFDNDAGISHNNSQYTIEHAAFSATVECQVINLASQLNEIPLHNVQLVTASALLDLTSAAWLNTLATLVNEHRCACLFALNYNGKILWQPELDTDPLVSTLLNQHQLNDKGFGPALGPEAGRYFAQTLEQLGRQICVGDSDWIINPQSDELLRAIIDGWAPAAVEQDGNAGHTVSQWHSLRSKAIDQYASTLTVGHIDILSLPQRSTNVENAPYS